MLLPTIAVVKNEAARVRRITGNDIEDWLHDAAVDAELDWSEILEDGSRGNYDVDSITCEIQAQADNYIDFVRKYYPEQIKEEEDKDVQV